VYRILFLSAVAALAQPANFEREIDANATHSHSFRAGAKQFVLITVHQLLGHVDITLHAPGEGSAESKRTYNGGYERLAWIAPASGEFKLEIARPAKTPAKYRLEIEIRDANEVDRARAAAYRTIFQEVPALQKKQTAASMREIVTKLTAAAAQAQEANDPELAGYAFGQLASAQDRLGDRGAALATIPRSIAVLKDLPHERHGWLTATIHMGVYQSLSGNAETAFAMMKGALALSREENGRDIHSEMLALNGLAIGSSRLGRYQDTLEYNLQLLKLAKEHMPPTDVATILANVGTAYANLGERQLSIESHAEALRIRREAGDLRATAYFQEASALYIKIGDRFGQSDVAMHLGDMHARNGDSAAAIQNFEVAVKLQREGKLLGSLTPTLSYLGELYAREGRWELAKAAAEEVLAVQAQTKTATEGPRLGVLLARVAEHENQIDKAVEFFNQAIAQARRAKRPEAEVASLVAGSAFHQRRGQWQSALGDQELALAIAENEASRIEAPESRATYHASRARQTVELVDLLMTMHEREPEAGYAARAYYAAERMRGRSLAELIAQPARRTASPEEVRLLEAVTSSQAKLFREGVPAAERKRLEAELTKVEFALDLFQRASSPKAPALFETRTE